MQKQVVLKLFLKIMNEAKKIIKKILFLFFDILIFGYNTIRQMRLPARQRKGNLLSSLYLFFIGIIERVGNFEHGIFRMTNVLRQKYVRQSLLIIAGLLFLLSSFEWANEKNSNAAGNYVEQRSTTDAQKTISSKYFEVANYSKTETVFNFNRYSARKNNFYLFPFFSSLKTYLVIRSLRI